MVFLQLVDLQQGLENGRQVPVPDVVEISDERYDKLYPVIDCPIFISQTDHAFGSGSSTETTGRLDYFSIFLVDRSWLYVSIIYRIRYRITASLLFE